MKPKPPTKRRRRFAVQRILKPKEFQTLLHNSPPETLPAFVLGGFCGISQAEICSLDWSAIDFQRKLITVNGAIAKTGHRRLVPLHEAAAAWLAPIAKKTGKLINLPSQNEFTTQLNQVWKEAKVEGHHSLRNSAIFYLFALGATSRRSAAFGFSLKRLFVLFRDLGRKRKAKAWFGLFPPNMA